MAGITVSVLHHHIEMQYQTFFFSGFKYPTGRTGSSDWYGTTSIRKPKLPMEDYGSNTNDVIQSNISNC
jgi:hypothetical protein